MYHGIAFHISQENSSMLWKVLACLPLHQYTWYPASEQIEAWNTKTKERLFVQDHYTGKAFLQNISVPQYLIFLKLQAYFPQDPLENIHTWEQWETSSCQLLLLLYDCEHVEVYAKDASQINAIYQSCSKHQISSVEFIQKETTRRTAMDVL